MTQEKKQEFTRRLTCCNRGEMIVISRGRHRGQRKRGLPGIQMCDRQSRAGGRPAYG